MFRTTPSSAHGVAADVLGRFLWQHDMRQNRENVMTLNAIWLVRLHLGRRRLRRGPSSPATTPCSCNFCGPHPMAFAVCIVAFFQCRLFFWVLFWFNPDPHSGLQSRTCQPLPVTALQNPLQSRPHASFQPPTSGIFVFTPPRRTHVAWQPEWQTGCRSGP